MSKAESHTIDVSSLNVRAAVSSYLPIRCVGSASSTWRLFQTFYLRDMSYLLSSTPSNRDFSQSNPVNDCRAACLAETNDYPFHVHSVGLVPYLQIAYRPAVTTYIPSSTTRIDLWLSTNAGLSG